MARRLLASGFLLASTSLAAQTAGSCDTGAATAVLNANDVEATLYTAGNLFYGAEGEHDYYVPASSGASAAYAGNLWVGGRVGGEFRVAAADFAQGSAGFEFWPGPLDEGATLPNPADCSAYDRIWVVSARDVAAYEAGGAPTADLAEWPVGLGAATVDAAGQPIETTDRGRQIDLAAGERPVVYGTQTAFWVMNDVGNAHRTTGSAPLGVEVQATAFAVASSEAALDQATFYRYRVVNRNDQPIDDLRLTWWTDTDLGRVNEYQGVDTTRAMGITYNAPTPDPFYGIPPATGVDFLDQPLGAYAVRFNGDSRRGEPQTVVEFDRAQRGLWNDGTPVTTYGGGYNLPPYEVDHPFGVRLDTTAFIFPGDPVTRSFWSEVNADGQGAENYAGNKRSLPTTRPVDLAPGESTTLTVAFLFSQGGDHLDSVRELRTASDRVQSLFDAGSLFETTDASSVPTAAPVLQGPADASDGSGQPVTLEWSAVPGAVAYRVEVASSVAFEDRQVFRARRTRWTADRLIRAHPAPFYWRVVAVSPGGEGPPSEVRSFTDYRYEPGPLMLDRQTRAYVEIVGPGGVDPCGPSAVSTFGCAEVGGNAIEDASNGTGQYRLVSGTAGVGDREVEIRWTGQESGSDAYFRVPRRVGRVPFQVWDIGVTPPGGVNDPSDDVRLIPEIPFQEECQFDFVDMEIGRRTSTIAAVYPTSAEALRSFEATAVSTGADGCGGSRASEKFHELMTLDYAAYGLALEAVAADVRARDLDGSVLRFYTADETLTRVEPHPGAPRASLRAPFPNPVSEGRVSVEFTLDVAGPARLVVVDVLGRELAVLVDGDDQAAGTHHHTVDPRGWASGVYAVVLQTASGAVSRPITVVR